MAREREQLQLQIAEASILVRLRQSDEGEEGGGEGAVLEKYYEARRELETLRQKISMEYEDEIEQLTDSKRSLEKKVGGASGWRRVGGVCLLLTYCNIPFSYAPAHPLSAGRLRG